jgi:hypothetical protein
MKKPRLNPKIVAIVYAVLACALLSFLSPSSVSFAGAKNNFSGSILLGDSYSPKNFRLSISSFDIGLSDVAELYAGSRLWNGNYYSGFGLGSKGVIYGMVGYEWRFLPWIGLTYEFDGVMSVRGDAAAKVYLGLVAGW